MLKSAYWLLIAVIVVVLDYWTKSVASAQLVYGQAVEVFSFFDLRLLHNTGAAFSFLAQEGGWQRWMFAGIAVIVSVALVVWLLRTPHRFWVLCGGLSLVIGGALGNLYDRIVHGYVVDFISVHGWGYYFPAFNIADVAISLGAALMLVDGLFLEGKRNQANHTPD